MINDAELSEGNERIKAPVNREHMTHDVNGRPYNGPKFIELDRAMMVKMS